MLYFLSITENISATISYMLFHNFPVPNFIHLSLQYVIKVVILSTCIFKKIIAVFVSSHQLIQKTDISSSNFMQLFVNKLFSQFQ